MRTLLINPAMNLRKLGRFASLLEPMPCSGIAYLAGALEARGHLVRAIDMFADNLDIGDVMQRIERFRPHVVGLSVMTPSAPVCTEISRAIRARFPAVHMVWGGIHADVFAADIVAQGDAHVVVHGDGEDAICELVEAWSGGTEDLTAVQGITWHSSDGVVKNAPRPLNTDLDRLPYPAWALFPYHRYGLLPFADIARPVLTMSASRGCPHQCAYCSLIHTHGRVFRRRDPLKVVDEYEFLVERYGVRQLGFVDPMFPMVKDDLPVLCGEIIRRGLDRRCVWLSETRADRLDRETCQLMYAAGCRRVLLGIESGSEELLRNVDKTLKLDAVREGIVNAHAAGLQTVGLFMIGLPGETPALTRQTVEFAVDLDLDFAKFAVTVPFPGSRLFAESWQKTLFRDDWENYTTFNPDPDRLVYHPVGYDPAELLRLQSWALRRFYFRPRQVRRQLLELRTLAPQVVLRGLYGVAG